MRKQRPPPKQRKVYRFLAKQGKICHGAAAVWKAAAKRGRIEIHRYYGERKGERILRVTHEEVEGAEVSAEVAAYEQATDQLLSMIKTRRESLEENERRRQEARRWA